MTAEPKTIGDYSACTTPTSNDYFLGWGNAGANTFKYKVSTLANSIFISNSIVSFIRLNSGYANTGGMNLYTNEIICQPINNSHGSWIMQESPNSRIVIGNFTHAYSIEGGYFQCYGKEYTGDGDAGGAELVIDSRTNHDTEFHVSSYGGSYSTMFKVRANTNDVEVSLGHLRIVDALNTGKGIVFGSGESGASPAIVTLLSSLEVGMLNIDGAPIQTRANTIFNAFNKADLPEANSTITGQTIYVVDDVGGPCLAVCNGSAWCKLTLGVAVS